MIIEETFERRCSVLDSSVTLKAAYYEDYRTGLRTPSRVEGCDAWKQCAARNEQGVNWSRCPYVGKEAKHLADFDL